jgi:hypothetical protein
MVVVILKKQDLGCGIVFMISYSGSEGPNERSDPGSAARCFFQIRDPKHAVRDFSYITKSSQFHEIRQLLSEVIYSFKNRLFMFGHASKKFTQVRLKGCMENN